MQMAQRLTILVLGGLLSSAAWAGEVPSRFTLGNYIPGDVWLYLHEVQTPERAWIDEKWDAVFDALKSTGLERDITSLAMSLLPSDEDRTAAEATVEKWTGLVKGVGWSALCGKEFAYAQRVGRLPTGYEYFLLTRSDPATATKNAANLVKLFKEVAALKEGLTVTASEEHGAKIWSLSVEEKGFPVSVQLLHKRDVVGLAVGRGSMSEVAALMAGKGKASPIAKTARFATAIKRGESPQHALSFFDVKGLLGDIKRMMVGVSELAKGSAKAADAENADKLHILKAITTIFDHCDIVDYVLETRETKGHREFRHTMTRLQTQKKKCALASCFLDRKPFQKFDRYVPVDASGFNLSTGVDIEAVYDFVLGVLKDDIPNGAEHLAAWEGIIENSGFNPKRDLFSWWGGEIISVQMPPAVVSPMGGSDWVFMIRVKDSEIARQKIDVAIDFLAGLAQGQGQGVMIGPADVKAEGFRQITHPMAAMFMRPVIGVTDGWLMVANSSGAINKCLDVAAGKAPSIATNERFKREGLTPKGAVLAASFTDTSKFGQELGQMVGAMGMGAGMATSMIPSEPGSDQIKKLIQKAAGMVMKLGPVFQKIDFYSSESSITTYDGDATIRGEKVIVYKTPTGEKIKTAQAR